MAITYHHCSLVSPRGAAQCWARRISIRPAAASFLWSRGNNIATARPSLNHAKLFRLGVGAFTGRHTIPVVCGVSLPGYSATATPDDGDDDGLKPTDNISVGAVKESVVEINGGSHSVGVGSEIFLLALPAVVGQAIDPLAQLMETAYIGRLGALELASAGIGVSIFNIISKIFNIPLLSISTSFVAEDISKNASKHSSSGKLELSSVSSALILAAGIGIIEALALFLGSGLFLKLMGVSPASPMHKPAKLFLSLRALGAPANVVMLAIQGIFRGFKDTKTPVLYLGNY